MRRALEPLAFLSLATALHAGAWVSFGAGGGGASAGGSGGEAALTLAAAGPQVAALVARWQAPPAIATAPAAPAAPAAPEAAAPEAAVPDPPAPGPAAPRRALAALPTATPDAAVDVALPARPPAPAAPVMAAPAAAPRPPASPPRPRPDPSAAPPGPAASGEARPAQRASGSGGGTRSGRASAPPADAAGPGARALEAEWGAAILSRIAWQQRYPAGARASGTARVLVTVGRDGRLAGARLAGSSGDAALDRAALEAVRRAGRFPPAPRGLEKASYVFGVPMTFRRD